MKVASPYFLKLAMRATHGKEGLDRAYQLYQNLFKFKNKSFSVSISQRKTVFRFFQFYEILEKDVTIFFRREDCIECDSQSYAVLKTEMRFQDEKEIV